MLVEGNNHACDEFMLDAELVLVIGMMFIALVDDAPLARRVEELTEVEWSVVVTELLVIDTVVDAAKLGDGIAVESVEL